MKISSLKPGMVVYSIGRQKMGNTTMTRTAMWRVLINEIAADGKSVVASWNGNLPRRYFASSVARWRMTPHKAKP